MPSNGPPAGRALRASLMTRENDGRADEDLATASQADPGPSGFRLARSRGRGGCHHPGDRGRRHPGGPGGLRVTRDEWAGVVIILVTAVGLVLVLVLVLSLIPDLAK